LDLRAYGQPRIRLQHPRSLRGWDDGSHPLSEVKEAPHEACFLSSVRGRFLVAPPWSIRGLKTWRLPLNRMCTRSGWQFRPGSSYCWAMRRLRVLFAVLGCLAVVAAGLPAVALAWAPLHAPEAGHAIAGGKHCPQECPSCDGAPCPPDAIHCA